MKNKVTQVCEYLLDRLERGELVSGQRLPPVRTLTERVDASYAIVVQAEAQLASAGILRISSRSGSEIRDGWQDCLMANHLLYFDPRRNWLPNFLKMVSKKLPSLRPCLEFHRGMFELRTTFFAQSHQDEYLNLAPFLAKMPEKKSAYFDIPFQRFRRPDGSIHVVPFLFSPRVMFYRTDMLKHAGLPFPEPNWNLEEFFDYLLHLRKYYAPNKIMSYSDNAFYWTNFLFRSGGALLLPDEPDPVKIDSPGTIRGVQLLRRLRAILDIHGIFVPDFNPNREPCAFMLVARQNVCEFSKKAENNWDLVPLPHISGGQDCTAQATELVCVRKECVNPEIAQTFLELMLSPEFQKVLADYKYGIPVLKSAVREGMDQNDPHDRLFLDEMKKMVQRYNVNSPFLASFIENGITRVIADESLPIEDSLHEIAEAVR
ncbi:MAG: extracellular solute-binding protein, partial [Victivallales bacterium]|nr:extracellular solute-binding protein [Victivallales bacterium]